MVNNMLKLGGIVYHKADKMQLADSGTQINALLKLKISWYRWPFETMMVIINSVIAATSHGMGEKSFVKSIGRYDTEHQWFVIILQNTYIEQASIFVK